MFRGLSLSKLLNAMRTTSSLSTIQAKSQSNLGTQESFRHNHMARFSFPKGRVVVRSGSTSLDQVCRGAITGRWSTDKPNFIESPRCNGRPSLTVKKLVDADFSAIEARIATQLTSDIHVDTACEMFGVLPGEVTPDMRRRAKAINFGKVYGFHG